MQMSLLLAIAFQDPSASLMQRNGHLAMWVGPRAALTHYSTGFMCSRSLQNRHLCPLLIWKPWLQQQATMLRCNSKNMYNVRSNIQKTSQAAAWCLWMSLWSSHDFTHKQPWLQAGTCCCAQRVIGRTDGCAKASAWSIVSRIRSGV